jgi:ribosomal protein S18 acetylase RimI-like enzyme
MPLDFLDIRPADVALLRDAVVDFHEHQTTLVPDWGGPARSSEEAWAGFESGFARWIGERQGFCIAARREDRVVGFVLCTAEEGDVDWDTGDPMGYIDTLGVVADERGRGIGSQLIERSIARFRELGFKSFMIEALPENEGAIRLYQRYAPQRASIGFVGRLE